MDRTKMVMSVDAQALGPTMIDLLGSPSPEADKILIRILVARFRRTPKDVTIAQFWKELGEQARPGLEADRALINGYGGNVQKRA